MYKRIFTYLLVLFVLVVGYSKVIDKYKEKFETYDRTLVVYNYDGKNYVGKYSYEQHLVTLLELDPKLNTVEDETIGDVKSAKELQKVVKDDFLYSTEDYFEFDGKNLVKTNLNNDSKQLYEESYNHYKVVKQILAGNPKKYHPDYNNELSKIALSVDSKDNGVINKSKVKKMIDEDIPTSAIKKAFVQIQKPTLKCENDICIIEEQTYNLFRSSYNRDTKYKLPEYGDIKKNLNKKSKKDDTEKEKAKKEKAKKEKAEKEKAEKEKAKKEKAEKEATTVEVTTVEPTTVEVTTVEPTTAEVTTVEPTTVEVTTVEPTTAEVTTVEPTTVEVTTVEPTTAEVTTVEPATVEATTQSSDVTTEEATTQSSDVTTEEATTQTSDVTTEEATTQTSEATTVNTVVESANMLSSVDEIPEVTTTETPSTQLINLDPEVTTEEASIQTISPTVQSVDLASESEESLENPVQETNANPKVEEVTTLETVNSIQN